MIEQDPNMIPEYLEDKYRSASEDDALAQMIAQGSVAGTSLKPIPLSNEKELAQKEIESYLAQAKGPKSLGMGQTGRTTLGGRPTVYNKDTGEYSYMGDDGTLQPVTRFDMPQRRESKGKGPTKDERKQAGLYKLGKEAEEQYQAAVTDGAYDPASYSSMIDQLSWWPDVLKSSKGRETNSAESAWVESFLRDASGAAIAVSERANYAKDFFPRAGDSPKTIANKKRLREAKMDVAKTNAGPAWTKSGDPASNLFDPNKNTEKTSSLDSDKRKRLEELRAKRDGGK